MTLSPAQIRRVLALSLVYRQALVKRGGPGWWCAPAAHVTCAGCTSYAEFPGARVREALANGWVWFPADSLTWLRATEREWEVCDRRVTIYIPPTGAPDDGGDFLRGEDVVDTVLAYFEATTHQETPCRTT